MSAKPTQSYESFLQELPAAREPPVLDLPAAQGAAATPALRHAVAAVPSSDKLRREWEAAAAEEDLDIQEIQPQSAGGPKVRLVPVSLPPRRVTLVLAKRFRSVLLNAAPHLTIQSFYTASRIGHVVH